MKLRMEMGMVSRRLGVRNACQVLLLAVVILAAEGGGGVARAQSITPHPEDYVTDGQVNALARTSDTVYIGGSFTCVSRPTGGGVLLDAATGKIMPIFPNVPVTIPSGTGIYTCVADGSGGWFIGGSFTKVGDLTRNSLAHILADGSVDPDWDPNPSGAFLNNINTLALAGSTLYVGGYFTNIGGQTRNNIAALDVATGAATNWNPNANNQVNAIAVSGSTVYAGGYFTHIGGKDRIYIAALDADGNATAWNPNASSTSSNSAIWTMAASGSTIYVGGKFNHIGGQDRNNIAALDTSGNATAWDPNASSSSGDPRIWSLAFSGSTIYVGGSFTHIGGQDRNSIAALDLATGATTSWDANMTEGTVYSIMAAGSNFYVAGNFSSFGGQARSNLASFDAASGNVTSWDPSAYHYVRTLAVSGSTVFAGGVMSGMDWRPRSNLAAFDATTGALAPWNPGVMGNTGDRINALAATSTTVFAGGKFTSIGGQPRNNVAAMDTASGQVKDWNPGVTSGTSTTNPAPIVNTLAVSSSTVYIGGTFSGVGGQTRYSLAAVYADSGDLSSWNPNKTLADRVVMAMAVTSSTVYVGGQFGNTGGKTRNNIAALDVTTGLATSWYPDPGASPSVNTLLLSGSTLYAGGGFVTMGMTMRKYLVALDTRRNSILPWNPNASGPVYALALSSSTLYAGGLFTSIGGQYRYCIAGVDIGTGLAKAWKPDIDNSVFALLPSSSTLYVAGPFTTVGGESRRSFAQFDLATPLAPSFTSQPAPQTVNPGATACFSVTAIGTAPLAYQWNKGAAALPHNGRIKGATSSTLTISGAQQGDEGDYTCVVTNKGGSKTSNPASLTVNDPPVFNTQPAPQAVNPGATVGFSVAATGTGPLTYQWKRDTATLINDSRISGATLPTLTLKSVQYADAGLYACVVTNTAGTSTSLAAKLDVNPALIIVSAYGNPNPAMGTTLYMTGTQVTARMAVTTLNDAAGKTRWVCTGWRAVGAAPASGSGSSTTFTIDRPTTITWQWKTQYKLAVTPLPAAGGSVTLGDGVTAATGWYDAGTALSLRPKYNTYYRFLAWWGDVQNSNSPLSLKLDKPCSLTAQFRDTRNGVETWGRYR